LTPYYDHGGITIYHGDAMGILPALPAASVSLVIADPPYHGVIDAEWDNQWETDGEFLAWFDSWVALACPLMRDNATLYAFSSPQMSARVEGVVRAHLAVIASVVWDKTTPGGKPEVPGLRTYWTGQTERIVVAECYGADNLAKGEAGYVSKCDEVRGFVFEPIRAYLDGERARAGVARKQINDATATDMAGHWFSSVQWALPTAEHYATIRACLNAGGGEYLRREYEDLRRPFFATTSEQWGDVWRFQTQGQRQHPTQKPEAMFAQIIRVSSRPGDVVLDPFGGSGTAMRAAKNLGRRGIMIEREERYCEVAAKRLAQEVLL